MTVKKQANSRYQIKVKERTLNTCNSKQTVCKPSKVCTDLENFIDETKTPPSQFLTVQVNDGSGGIRIEHQLNPEYQKWKKSDQIFLFWLISTLSQKVVGQVTKCKSSLEAWTKLQNLYSQKSMKGSHSMSDFVLKIKNIGDAFSAAGEEVSERDLLLSLIHGVRHEYDIVVVLTSSQRSTMSLEEAQFLLLIHEQRIEELNSSSSFGGPTANYAATNARRGNSGNFNRHGSRSRGRGGRFGGRNLYCQLCTKPSHHAFQCFYRFDQQFFLLDRHNSIIISRIISSSVMEINHNIQVFSKTVPLLLTSTRITLKPILIRFKHREVTMTQLGFSSACNSTLENNRPPPVCVYAVNIHFSL
ncbi:hypothetical protein ACOSQ4_012420 [Xanthoceras sorbifolium]